MNRAARPSRRRGVVLFAVLLVVAGAALVVTGMLAAGESRLITTRAETERARSRALAWSGVRAAMAQIEEQRDLLLGGAEPRIELPSPLFVGDDGRAGVVLLEEVAPDRPWASEAGKLNLNAATAEMIAKLPGLSPDLAGRIVSARGSSGFASIEELAWVPGLAAELLNNAGEEDDSTNGSEGLYHLVTVSSFDPRVQAANGLLRVRPRGEWTPRLEAAVRDRVGEAGVAPVRRAFAQAAGLRRTSQVVNMLRTLGVAVDEWGKVLDLLSVIDDEFAPGLVDINAAPVAVLACIPGIDADIAEQIVSQREGLDDETRRNLAWPVARGLMTPEQFEQAADWITVRSLQFRVRVAAGFQRESRGRADEFGVFIESARDLEFPVVFEAVIDAATRRVRVSFLREVTGLDDVRAFAASQSPRRSEGEEAAPAPAPESSPPMPPAVEPVSLDLRAGLELAGVNLASPGSERPTRRAGARRGGAPTERADTRPAPPPEPRPSVDRRSGRWRTPGGAQAAERGEMEPRE